MVAVRCLVQVDRDTACVKCLSALCHVLRPGYVLVIRDATVFIHLHKEVVVHGLHLVLFTNVAGKESCIEVGGRLVLVVSASIKVVDVEAERHPFVGIHGEVGFEALFPIELVSSLVISQIGVRYVAVGEFKIAWREVETRHGFEKQRMRFTLPLKEQA